MTTIISSPNSDILPTVGYVAALLSVLIPTIIFFSPVTAKGAETASVGSDFYYTFNVPGTLMEAGSMTLSSSPYFYLNSGGKLLIEGDIGTTATNELSEEDPFYSLYKTANSLDTDGGHYPQNIFRLLTRSQWHNAISEMAFKITSQNFSDSPNRDGHNGVLLMTRYQDSDNLYYAGIRNDGLAVIKKKIDGVYHTLATVQIFGTPGKYDRYTKPSLLPFEQWTRMKVATYNLNDGSVRIRLWLDRENDGSYVSILAADDNGVGGAPIKEAGHSGIRTDFMDVTFDNWRLRSI